MTFQKGEAGTKGQTRTKPFRDAFVSILSREEDDKLNDRKVTIAHKLALDMVREAVKGDQKVRMEIIERVEGKAKQAVIGGEDDDPPINVELSLTDSEIIKRYNQQKDEKK